MLSGGLALAQPPVVQPRTLMTAQDRSEYRQSMREARTPEAKQQVREQKYAMLRQRAAERGMVMAEPGAKMPGMRGGESGRKNPGAGEGQGPELMMMTHKGPQMTRMAAPRAP